MLMSLGRAFCRSPCIRRPVHRPCSCVALALGAGRARALLLPTSNERKGISLILSRLLFIPSAPARRSRGLAVTAALALCGLPAAAFAQSVVVDDFNDGDLDGWEVTEDEFGPWGGANFGVTNGVMLMQTNEVVPANVPLFTSAGIKKSDIETNDFYYHGVWTYEVTLNNEHSAFFHTVRGDTLGPAAAGVFIQHGTAVAPGYIGIDIYRNGFQIDTDFLIWPVEDNVTYLIEVQAVDDFYGMRVWPKGGVRPDAPQVALTNAEPMFTPALTTFMFTLDERNGRLASRVSVGVDNIVFTPDYRLEAAEPFFWGEVAEVSVRGATPLATQYVIYSLAGEGVTPIPQLGVDAGILSPKLAGTVDADSTGEASFGRRLPNRSRSTPVWLQVLQQGGASNVVLTQIN